MRHLCHFALFASAASVVAGCSASGSLRVGIDDEQGGGGSAGHLGTGGNGVVITGDASVSKAFGAHIESPSGITVTFVTLSCSQDCADVVAVATGGFAPYGYRWEDGSTNAARRVCARSTTAYEVQVTDHGSLSPEFSRDPQTVRVPLTANFLECPDGGVGADGGSSLGECSSVAADFVASGTGENPHGPWTYGWTKALGAPLTLFTTFYPFTPASLGAYYGAGYPDAAQWFDKANGFIDAATYYSVPPVPEVAFNPTAAPSHPSEGNLAGNSWTLAPGQFALVPGAAGQYAVARWSARASGTHQVTAVFEGVCGDNGLPTSTADVHVLRSGTEIGSALLNASGTGNAFTLTRDIDLNVGESVDFVVGAAGGLFLCPDATALQATICRRAPR